MEHDVYLITGASCESNRSRCNWTHTFKRMVPFLIKNEESIDQKKGLVDKSPAMQLPEINGYHS